MANEPQRDIEKDLLAYKQRRGEQAGAPLELHPATRKLLQGEVARTTGRPLLTSEEAAKNFVRSFVMSHQQPGFFARHRPRIIWGGAMFACLALVLAVLRHDPQQAARETAFASKLPAPPPAAEPQAATPHAARPQSGGVANQPAETAALFMLEKREASPTKGGDELARLTATPAGGPAVANPVPRVVSDPQPRLEREVDRRSNLARAPMPTAAAATRNERGASTADLALDPGLPNPTGSAALPLGALADRKLAEKPAADGSLRAALVLKEAEAATGGAAFKMKKAQEEAKAALVSDEVKRAQAPGVAGGGGGAGAFSNAPMDVASRSGAFTAGVQMQSLAFGTTAPPAEAAQVQQFQQLDTRANLRPSFTAKPPPDVMKDFAFERNGDRVRIVDADGSTYEGMVLDAPAERLRAKMPARPDAAKAVSEAESLQRAAGQPVPAAATYRFIANGVNRKLNQSVEFRGEWQPTAPVQATAPPAVQPVSYGVVRLEVQVMEKKLKALVTNALADKAVPAQGHSQSAPKELPQGRISGRAVVGGKEEFEIKAVTK